MMVRIKKELHKKVKDNSEDTGKKIQRIVEDAVEEYLEKDNNWKNKIVKK